MFYLFKIDVDIIHLLLNLGKKYFLSKVGVVMKNKIKFLIIAILIIYLFIAILTNNNIGNCENMSQYVNVNIPKSEQMEYITINNCSNEALISLPNIGDVLASRIIENRPYQDVYQLVRIKGISECIIQNIKDKVICE
jgi:competence protein ComEA